jgi:hypothetical protein
MNKKAIASILVGTLLALASGAKAQSALEQLGALAGVDSAPLVSQMKAVRASNPGPVVCLPRQAKDVLADCNVLEAKPIYPWNISQAAILVQTCLNHVYLADGEYRVQAQAARFTADDMGIKITVVGSLPAGDRVMYDLRATLARRDNTLLGFETSLEDQTTPALR